MDSGFAISFFGYIAVLAMVFVLSRLRSTSARADRLMHVLLGLVLSYPVVVACIYLFAHHQDFMWIILVLLATTLMGIVAGATLLVWFTLFAGLWDRRFRSSLHTLVLFVLAVASAFSLCVAIDGFWLPELFLCAFTIPAFIWSILRDRELHTSAPGLDPLG